MDPRRPTSHTQVLAALCVLGLGACDDLAEFRGRYEGSIVEGGFVRDCFGADVKATLRFDPELASTPLPDDLPASRLNRLTTSDGTFDDTLLVPISALPHDPLSKLDFPGSRRLRSYLMFARPDSGPLEGRDATVVVSLMADEKVELRVMARSAETEQGCGAEATDGDAGAPTVGPRINEYFGLFLLE